MTEEQRAVLLGEIEKLLEAKESCAYFLAVRINALRESGMSADDINDSLNELVGRQVFKQRGQVTKYAVWGRMPDTDGVQQLGITRAYALREKHGWLEDAQRAADPTDSYTWCAFDAEWLGKLPPEEREWCQCPVCDHRHPKK